MLPELAELHDVEQSHYHHRDVYGHTIEVLERLLELEARAGARLRAVLDEPLADELTRGEALRFGALLHDIGKPATHAVRESGRVTFMGHDRLGEQMVHDLCRRLRTSERFSRFVEALTRHHLVLGFLVHERPLDRRAVYRYLRRTEPVEVEVTLLSCADRLATRGRKADEAIAAHMELAERADGGGARLARAGPPAPLVRGDELARELGIEPGPEIGRLLAALEEAAYAGEVATRDEALGFARRLRDNRSQVIVDCAIYEAGHRRDGKVELEHAYDLRQQKDTFVWIGLYEPTEEEFDALRARVQPSSARRRGRHPRAPASEARGVRRHGAARAEDGALRRPHGGGRAR